MRDDVVTKYGHYNPWLFIGTTMVAIAGGLFSTFKVNTGNSMINGVQVLGGLGSACAVQMVCLGLHLNHVTKRTLTDLLSARHRSNVHSPSKRHSDRDFYLSFLPILRRRNLLSHRRKYPRIAPSVRFTYLCTNSRCNNCSCCWCGRFEKSDRNGRSGVASKCVACV